MWVSFTRTGIIPLRNGRFAYAIISNDVFVYISEPHSKACLWFIFEIQFHHVSPQFTVTNGSTVTCATHPPPSCGDYSEVAFPRGESRRLKREVALFSSLSCSKAQPHSATVKLLKMKMQLWQLRPIPRHCEGWLTASLPDCANDSAGKAPQLILSMFL